MNKFIAGCFSALLLVGSMIGCGKWDKEVTLTTIVVTPANPSITKGQTKQFTAVGTYSDNHQADLTATATWTSATTTVATINSTGLATSLIVGTSVITATSGTVSGNTTLTVTAATLTSITVSPLLPSIAKGRTQQFVATGHYSDTTTQVLTTSAIWTSGTVATATMNANSLPTSGLATGVALGTSVITATSGGLSGSTTLTVTAATLTTLVVTPVNPSTTVGATQQFIATGTFSDLSTQILTTSATCIWSSSTVSVATMNPSGQLTSGLATGVAVGTSTITATSGVISGNTTLTVTAAVPPAGHLGSASTYGIMASAAITNVPTSQINGDVALEPGTSNGLLPAEINGVIHINDSISHQAYIDLLAGYNYYATLPPGTTIPAGTDLGALYPISIAPGTYTSGSTMLVSTPLVFDGGGNANATWVFQIGSSLTTSASISLIGNAQAKNIFWVCTADATVGIGTIFHGTIIAGSNITTQTGAVVNGRLLAGALGLGTIALDSTTVNVPAP